MKLHFSKRNKIIIGIAALLLVLVVVVAQFMYLSPLKTELASKQLSLDSEQKLLEAASQKKAEDTNKTVENTRELQKKLPVKPLQEQLILDLEKAENLSNSKISSMSFTKDADVNMSAAENADGQQNTAANQNTANQTVTNTNTADQSAANQGTASQDGSTQQTVTVQTSTLKKLTVSLSVESPNYEKLEKFIETLETLNRIVVVESISYSGGQEITSLVQESTPLTYSLTISAFYMPTLADLAAELPKIEAPAPAGKENPLSQFPATATTKP